MKILYLSIAIATVFIFYSCNNNQPTTEVKTTVVTVPVQVPDTVLMKVDTSDPKYKSHPYLLAYDRALMLWNVPIKELDFDTKYGKAHVITCGPETGEPLVLLHGMNASSTMWYPNIKALSQKYRVYAIDFLLEPGKSICQNEISNTDQIMDWYDEVFKNLNLTKFSMVGASRGGWLATNIALRNQSRINKLVLLSPAQTFVWIKPGTEIIKNIVYTISPKRKRLREVLETMSFNVDSIDQVFIDQYYLSTKNAEVKKCMAEMQPFSEKELKSLKIPTLVLIGDKDIINSKKSLKRAKKFIPNVQTYTINNAGHFLSIDAAQEINEKTLLFLQQQ